MTVRSIETDVKLSLYHWFPPEYGPYIHFITKTENLEPGLKLSGNLFCPKVHGKETESLSYFFHTVRLFKIYFIDYK